MSSVLSPSPAVTSLFRTRVTLRVWLAAWLALAVAVPQASASDAPPADARSHTHIDVVSSSDTLVATVRAKQSGEWGAAVTWVCADNPFAFVTPGPSSRLLEGVGLLGRLRTRAVLHLAARPPPHN